MHISRLKKLNRHDVNTRDEAILYINGEIFEAHTHSEAIKKYLKIKSNNINYNRNSEFFNDLEDNSQIAFAHKVNDIKSIFIEDWTLKNVDINTIVLALKNKYSEYTIYNDSDEEIIDNNNLDKYVNLEKDDNNNSIPSWFDDDYKSVVPDDWSNTINYDSEYDDETIDLEL